MLLRYLVLSRSCHLHRNTIHRPSQFFESHCISHHTWNWLQLEQVQHQQVQLAADEVMYILNGGQPGTFNAQQLSQGSNQFAPMSHQGQRASGMQSGAYSSKQQRPYMQSGSYGQAKLESGVGFVPQAAQSGVQAVQQGGAVAWQMHHNQQVDILIWNHIHWLWLFPFCSLHWWLDLDWPLQNVRTRRLGKATRSFALVFLSWAGTH